MAPSTTALTVNSAGDAEAGTNGVNALVSVPGGGAPEGEWAMGRILLSKGSRAQGLESPSVRGREGSRARFDWRRCPERAYNPRGPL